MTVPVLLYPMGGIALVSFLSGVVAGYRGGGSDAAELASDDAMSVLTTASVITVFARIESLQQFPGGQKTTLKSRPGVDTN